MNQHLWRTCTNGFILLYFCIERMTFHAENIIERLMYKAKYTTITTSTNSPIQESTKRLQKLDFCFFTYPFLEMLFLGLDHGFVVLVKILEGNDSL